MFSLTEKTCAGVPQNVIRWVSTEKFAAKFYSFIYNLLESESRSLAHFVCHQGDFVIWNPIGDAEYSDDFILQDIDI